MENNMVYSIDELADYIADDPLAWADTEFGDLEYKNGVPHCVAYIYNIHTGQQLCIWDDDDMIATFIKEIHSSARQTQ
jgi:hypothetical protein